MRSWLFWVLLVGILILTMSIIGCFGLHRQIIRSNRCGGRCLLSWYELLMIGLLVIFAYSMLSLRALATEMQQSIEAGVDTYGHHEQFALAPYFDSFYWKTKEATEADRSGYGWFKDWTANNCPLSMEMESCTSCYVEATYTDGCCPREDLCSQGNLDACPYKRCRTGVITLLRYKLGPIKQLLLVVIIGMLIVLVNTVLLICYNPRDSLAVLLAKTGVMIVHEEGGYLGIDDGFGERGPGSRTPPRRSGYSPTNNTLARGRRRQQQEAARQQQQGGAPRDQHFYDEEPMSPSPAVLDVEGSRIRRPSPTHMV